MSTATLSYTLPDEAEAHRTALDGARWRSVVATLDEQLRAEAKYGSGKRVEGARWAREALWAIVKDEGLLL